MKKRILGILLVFVMLLGMVGCSQGSGGENENVGKDSADVEGAQLVIYTNSGSDGRDEWLTKRAKEAGFNITVVNGAIANRLIAEKNSPIADIVWGLNSFSYEILKEQNVLESYKPDWADEVSEGLNDEDGYYYATALQACLLVYDSADYSADEAPKDWPDLWTNSKYSGKYEYATDTGAITFRCFLAGILSRYADEDGYLGVSDEGWKQVEAYYDNGVSASSGTDLYARISDKSSPVSMGQMWSSGIQARDTQYGTKTAYAVPEVGVPFAVEALAMVKGSSHPKEALRFINWFGSADIQAEFTEEFSMLPANENALSHINEFNQGIASLKKQEIDWKWVAEYVDDWCEEIELMYK